MRSSCGLALIGALLLAVGASAEAQMPTRDGDTWGGQRHSPTEAQVEPQEGASAGASARSQDPSGAGAVDQIYRVLMELEHPAAGSEDSSGGLG